MIEDRYLLFFLIVHAVFCIVLGLLHVLGVIRTTRRLLLLAMLLPVWGAAMAYIAESYARKKKIGSRTDELPVLNDNHFSFLLQPVFLEEGTGESVVPLEEALLLEEPAVRRELMLDIIQEDPKRYISMLKKVRLGDDAEVSHYASTALMQIQREYEMDLRKKEDALHARSGDEEAVSAYLDKLKEYIQSGLLADNAVMAQRRKLNTMLVQLLAESDGDKQLYADAVENLIALKEYTAAESLLEEADSRWKHDETLFLLKLQLYHKTKNGWEIKKAVQQIKESGIYLSPSTQEIVAFWSGKSEGQP